MMTGEAVVTRQVELLMLREIAVAELGVGASCMNLTVLPSVEMKGGRVGLETMPFLILGLIPMRRQVRHCRAEFKSESRVTGGNQIVIDLVRLPATFHRSNVAPNAHGRTSCKWLREGEAKLLEFVLARQILPVDQYVSTRPLFRRAVARFAAHSIGIVFGKSLRWSCERLSGSGVCGGRGVAADAARFEKTQVENLVMRNLGRLAVVGLSPGGRVEPLDHFDRPRREQDFKRAPVPIVLGPSPIRVFPFPRIAAVGIAMATRTGTGRSADKGVLRNLVTDRIVRATRSARQAQKET